MKTTDQKEIIDNILVTVNHMTQCIIELQEEVVKLRPTETAPAKKVVKPLTKAFIKSFRSFRTDIISTVIEGNLVKISYNKGGKITTFNKQEVYDIFINLPNKFDIPTIKECLESLNIENKNEMLLMRFFIYQFDSYCKNISKGKKDKLIVQKL